jgi:CP family cyanate transporter-like MFS transporter
LAKPTSRAFWAVATVVCLTLLLRPPLAAIGPLLGLIQKSMSLSTSELSLLTSVPVLCFGVGAFAGPKLQQKFGLGGSFAGILALLTIVIATREWFGFGYLLVGTVAMGLGIAVSNVLFPALIRAEFSQNVPKMTAFYTTLLSGFSAVASAIAYPAALALGSWQLALAVIAIPGALGLFTWLIALRHPSAAHEPTAQVGQSHGMWRHPLTWAIAAFFGLQSSNFYVLLNWLPTILVNQGMAETNAGAIVGLMSIVGVPVGMLITANLKRIRNLPVLIIAISAVTSMGVLGYSLGTAWVIPASILTGFGLSSSFPLSLAHIGMKGSNQAITTGLSSVAQGVGYLVAAAAVYLAGLSYDLTGTWTVAITSMIVMSILQAFAGIYAAKHPIV